MMLRGLFPTLRKEKRRMNEFKHSLICIGQEVKIIKDDWFATNKWFVVDAASGSKWNVIGFKTKAKAVNAALACDAKVVTFN